MKTFSMQPGAELRELIPCPLCGEREFRPLWSGTIPFVRCRNCRAVYQNPQPRQEDLSERYNAEYFAYERENEENFFTLMRLGLEDIGFDELKGKAPQSFLDIGCATGMLLDHLKREGFSEQGVEICAPAAEFGIRERGLSIHIGDLESAGFSDESFGFVHSSHVIEHLTDPKAFLDEIYRILVPGGYLLLTTPDIAGFQARIFGERWRSAIHDHMLLFSRHTLRMALRTAGFKVLKRRSWGGLAVGSAPKLVKKVADRLCKRLNQGDVMMFAAQKPSIGGS